MFSSFDPL
jgi:uncharacterized surface protein with fasciclin (FAS1) repeats